MEKIIIDGNLINIEDFLSDTDKTYYAEPIKDGEIEGLINIGVYVMRDKLIEIIENGERKVLDQTIRGTSHYTEALADYLIANNVFVLPETMKDSWELALPFMVRLFVSDEAEIEKIKGEFEFSQKKKILTDIRDYLVKYKEALGEQPDFVNFLLSVEVQVFVDQALSDLTEYAEKLGVEL